MAARNVPLHKLGLIDVYKDVLPNEQALLYDQDVSPAEKMQSIINQTVYNVAQNVPLSQVGNNDTMKTIFEDALLCLDQYVKDKANFEAMKAILANDVATVKAYYKENKAQINEKFNCFWYYGENWLLEQYITKLNHTPLTLATKLGHVDMVKVLVALGADSTITSSDGLQPVHIASKKGVVELLYFFIHQCGISASSITSNDEMKTPLMLAAAYRRNQVVKFLLENGANVNQTNKQGRPALFYAVQVGAMNVIKSLRDNEANMTIVDKKGGSAIHYLYSKQVQITPVERFIILKYLVDVCGLKIDAAMNDGSHVLHKVVQYGTYNEVKFVIKRDGQSIHARKSGWKTPIWSALMSPKRNRKVLALLLRYGASIYDINKDGLSMVGYAIHVLRLNEIADLIVRIGTSIKTRKIDLGDDHFAFRGTSNKSVQVCFKTEEYLKDEESYEGGDEAPNPMYEDNEEGDVAEDAGEDYGFIEDDGQEDDNMAPPPPEVDTDEEDDEDEYQPNYEQQIVPNGYHYSPMGEAGRGYNNGLQYGANQQYYMAEYQGPGYVAPQPVAYAVDGNVQYQPMYFVPYIPYENQVQPQQGIGYPVYFIPYYGQFQGDAGAQYYYPQPPPVYYVEPQPYYAYQPQEVGQGFPADEIDDGDDVGVIEVEEIDWEEEDEYLEVIIDEPLD